MIVKLFLGWLLTFEIKNCLNRSELWKRDSLFDPKLLIVPFEKKEYIGVYFPEEAVRFNILKVRALEIKEICNSYLPDQRIDEHRVVIFPQSFIH